MIAVVVAMLAPVAVDATASARVAESAAFAAVEGKRWCEAMHRFLEAHGYVPNADLVFNAAQAAEYAEDRARAVQLYTLLLGESDKRKEAARKRINALTKLVEKSGVGTSCPALPPLPPQELAPPPATTTTTTTTTTSAPTPADSAVTTVEVVPAPPPAASPLPWPLILLGAGGGVALLGGVVAAVGSVPFFQHGAAREALAAAEASGRTDGVAALQEQHRTAREGWEGWGRPATIGGALLASAGLLAAAAGGIVMLSGGAE
jgi:hypothetical protein